MRLRNLKLKDAHLMIEWMHDDSVTQYMRTDFASMNVNDALSFIQSSNTDKKNYHLAVVSENDEYMGTVSLKNITVRDAEFAITIRACAMGKGYAKYAMNKIIEIGLSEKKLDLIYWCVDPSNQRAVRFYDKNGYEKVDPSVFADREIPYSKEQIFQYYWYIAEKNK